MKIGLLAIAPLLLSTPCFASQAPEAKSPALPQPAKTVPSTGILLAIEVDGQPLMSFPLGEPSQETQISIESPTGITYDAKSGISTFKAPFSIAATQADKVSRRITIESDSVVSFSAESGVTTLKAPFSISATQGDKVLWHLSVPTGSVTMKQVPSPETPIPLMVGPLYRLGQKSVAGLSVTGPLDQSLYSDPTARYDYSFKKGPAAEFSLSTGQFEQSFYSDPTAHYKFGPVTPDTPAK